MGVYIKNVKKPTRCEKCQFFVWDRIKGNRCVVSSEVTFHACARGADLYYERNGDCPLIELPENHGQLIDRDALEKDIEGAIVFSGRKEHALAEALGANKVIFRIRTAPVIIEGES